MDGIQDLHPASQSSKSVSSYGKSPDDRDFRRKFRMVCLVSGFPSNGGWSIALKLHRSAHSWNAERWLYWEFYWRSRNRKCRWSIWPLLLWERTVPNMLHSNIFASGSAPISKEQKWTLIALVVASSFVDPQNLNWTSVLINTSTVKPSCDRSATRFNTFEGDSIHFQWFRKVVGYFWLIPTNGDLTFSMKPFSVITINGKLDQTTIRK